METRKLNMQFAKAGSGSISARLCMPKSWMDELNINQDERGVIAIFDEIEGQVIIRKIRENESDLNNQEIKGEEEMRRKMTIEHRRERVKAAEAFNKLGNSEEMDGYGKILSERYIQGEITANEWNEQLIQYYREKYNIEKV